MEKGELKSQNLKLRDQREKLKSLQHLDRQITNKETKLAWKKYVEDQSVLFTASTGSSLLNIDQIVVHTKIELVIRILVTMMKYVQDR